MLIYCFVLILLRFSHSRSYCFRVLIVLVLTHLSLHSSIRQHWITPETITRRARKLSAFMLIVVSSGTVASNSYRMYFFFELVLYLLVIILCSCLAHVVNLGNIAVMTHITKIAAVENATAIWEYDPTRNDNRVLGNSLDVIAAIRTLAIKVKFNLFLVRVLLF